jgi:hypothetical protein
LPAEDITPHGPLPAVVVKSRTTVPAGGCVVVDVLELVDVELVVGAPVVDVVGTPDVDVVLEPGTVVVDSPSRILPLSVVAPGPGSDVAPLISGLVVAGTQNTEASVVSAGTPRVSGPAGLPVSRISRQDCESGFVKHPACDWLGQNMPVALESSRVPVESGASDTGMTPTSCAQTPPPVHCELVVHAVPLFEPR